MATITNQATTSYQFEGSSDVLTTQSNENTITLQENTGLLITKNPSTTTFANGTIITYTITIANSTSNFLNGVRIIDNLGGGNLAYVLGSGRLAVGGQSYAVNPIATSPLTFTLQQLAAGQAMTLVYSAQVLFNLPTSVTSITNTVQGIGYTSTGTITGGATSTITRGSATGEVTSTKTNSEDTVIPNQPFSYIINLSNTSDTDATALSTTDQLASNFVLSSVELQIGSNAPITLDGTDYTLTAGNLLTIPSASGPTVTIPANGETTLTISGSFEG